MCGAKGTIHIFRMMSQVEIMEQVQSFQKNNNNSIYNFVKDIMPTNMTMNGSQCRIHLTSVSDGPDANILHKLTYAAYVQSDDSMLLSVLTESGHQLIYSIPYDDLISLNTDKLTANAKALNEGQISFIPSDMRLKWKFAKKI